MEEWEWKIEQRGLQTDGIWLALKHLKCTHTQGWWECYYTKKPPFKGRYYCGGCTKQVPEELNEKLHFIFALYTL